MVPPGAIFSIQKQQNPLYITHYPLIYVYTAWVVNNNVPLGTKGLLVGLLLVVASIGLAYCCLKLYDEPVREWLKRKVLIKKERAYTKRTN